MRKTITRVTACSIIAALVITTFPASTVKASTILPAVGLPAITGVGSNIKDIQAEKARVKAKEESAKVHKRESVSSSVALASANASADASQATQMPTTPENVQKVETPASKALNAQKAEEATGAKAATIEVTDARSIGDDGAVKVVTNSSKIIDEQKVQETPQDAETLTVSVDAAVPEIEIRPESGDVAEGEQDLTTSVIAQVDGYVNVRDTPSEEGEIVGKLYNHSAGEWIGKEGDWYKISSGNVVGYVKGEYVVTGQAAVKLAAEVGIRTATVHTTTLRIREEANADSTILGLVPDGDKLTVVEETDEWVKVSIEEGDGWVSKEFVSIVTEFPQAESKAEEEARLKKEKQEREKANAAAQKASKKQSSSSSSSSGGGVSYSAPGSGLGTAVANYGLQFVGNPYVYGGTSLTNGTDCSGFTMGVYKNFGVSLPHSSGAQRSVGYAVGSLAEAQPGDIICYSGHVAIYIGGGQIVHASTKATGIKVSSASYRQILAIRRIF